MKHLLKNNHISTGESSSFTSLARKTRWGDTDKKVFSPRPLPGAPFRRFRGPPMTFRSLTTQGVFALCLTFIMVCGTAHAEKARKDAPLPLAAMRELHGNRQSHIYHNPQCRYYNCKACTVILSSRREARERGFRPCKVCGG